MVERTTLANGLRVVTERVPYVRSVSIGFWLLAGARHETAGSHGVSHFIEHLLFKGTETRSAREIAETIDGAGGQLNAFTTREATCYYARVMDQHVGLAIDLLADMLARPRLDEGDIEKEKSVILEEIRMVEDTPEDVAHELFMEKAFRDHPLSRSVLGTPSSVSSLDRRVLRAYMAERYRAPYLVVAAAGRIDHEAVVGLVTEQLRDFRDGCKEPEAPQAVDFIARQYWREKDSEQVHLCIGGPGLPRSHPDRFALIVLDTALGGSVSSRLFQQLREEHGLVYNVYSFHDAFQDAGLFGVYAAVAPAHVIEVVQLIERELAQVRAGGLDARELARAKEQLKGSLMLNLESTSTRMHRLAKAELFENPLLSPDELLARVDAVTADDVARVAAAVLDTTRWTCVGVGPRVKGAFAPFGWNDGSLEMVS